MALQRNVAVCVELSDEFPEMEWHVRSADIDDGRTVVGRWSDLEVRLSWSANGERHSASVFATLADTHHPKRFAQLSACEGSEDSAVSTVRQVLVAAVGCLRDTALKCNTLIGED